MLAVAAPDPAIVVPIEPFHPVAKPRVAPVTVAPERSVEVVRPLAIARPVEPVRAVDITPAPAPVPPPAGHAAEPPKPVQMAGFDAPAAHALPIDIKRTTVGAFDAAPAGETARPGSERPNVADAGFGAAMARTSTRPAARQVADADADADAGFGAARADATPAHAAAAVKPTGFDALETPRAAVAAPRPIRIDDPVEILTKPTPTYTDEARALKIEGDVVLDVEFTAAGDVHVLRVVRGLGHGLDEAATRAALGMRFKPAQSAGRPVDFRTTVHIVFRLA